MVWYFMLIALAVIFALLVCISLFFFFIDWDWKILLAVLIFGISCAASVYGGDAIKKAHTTSDIDVVQMEVTKCDITSVCLRNGMVQQDYHIVVDNKYIIRANAAQYAQINVGDTVAVKITTETRFGKTLSPTITLV